MQNQKKKLSRKELIGQKNGLYFRHTPDLDPFISSFKHAIKLVINIRAKKVGGVNAKLNYRGSVLDRNMAGQPLFLWFLVRETDFRIITPRGRAIPLSNPKFFAWNMLNHTPKNFRNKALQLVRKKQFNITKTLQEIWLNKSVESIFIISCQEDEFSLHKTPLWPIRKVDMWS